MENDPMREKVLTALFVALVCACLVAVFAGCASTKQELVTADGDRYSRTGRALFSKQDTEGRANLVAYPNGSGLEFQIGDAGAQDSTQAIEALRAVIALGQALAVPAARPTAAPGGDAGAQEPGTIGRLNNALAEIARLREQVDRLRELYGGAAPQRPKSAVGPAAPPQ